MEELSNKDAVRVPFYPPSAPCLILSGKSFWIDEPEIGIEPQVQE